MRWAILGTVVLLTLGLVARNHYVLDSQKLDTAIKTELPPGTPKAQVIQFIEARKPMFWDDAGSHLRTRMTGRAGNLIYRKDIILDFEFDASGKLLSFSRKEYPTFL